MNIDALRNLILGQGPFVTIYASSDPARENAAQLFELRWKEILTSLENDGVDRQTLELIRAERGYSRERESGIRVVITSGQGEDAKVAYSGWMPGRSDVDIVSFGALPHLLPLLDWNQRRVPHVVVLVDRVGVDVIGYVGDPQPAFGRQAETTPPPWTKTHAGGWAARRYESHVEEHWKLGAKADAELVTEAVADIGAEIVVMGGDPRAVSLLREQLPVDVATKVVVIPASRSRDGSADETADRVLEVVADWERRRVGELLADFHRYTSRARALARAVRPGQGAAAEPATVGGRVALDAADGIAATFAALRRAQVSDLLFTDSLDVGIPAWFGPEPTDVALRAEELTDLGVDSPVSAPAVDVLVRGALGTGARVWFVPADHPQAPADGVGALLRYTLPV